METLVQSAPTRSSTRIWPPQTRKERVIYAIILSTGALCFVLMAWVHLGLGALIFPPAATAQQQIAQVGGYTLTLQETTGQLTADGPNTVTLSIRDASGKPIPDASPHIQAVMTSMGMVAPSISATAQSAGVYALHPKFGMAGDWRLDVTLTQPGQAPRNASFTVSVRWS